MVRTSRVTFRMAAFAAAAALSACSAGSDGEPEGTAVGSSESDADAVEVAPETGTQGDEPEQDAPDAAEVEEPPVTDAGGTILWTLEEPLTVAGPVAADGVAFVQRISGPEDARRLELVAVDIDTGERLWDREVSPGGVVPGIAVGPVVVEDQAVYFEEGPIGSGVRARLVVADPRTGAVAGRSSVQEFSTIPGACPDGPTICVNAWVDGEVRWWEFPLVSDGAGLEPVARRQPDADFTRPIGEGGLIDLRRGDQEFLAVHEDGEVLWERPIADVMGPGSTTSGGWWWRYVEDDDRLIGHVGSEGHEVDGSVRVDLGERPLVALERSTGERLWMERGVEESCSGRLEVPSDADLAALIAGDETSAPSLPVWCRTEGQALHTLGDAGWEVEYVDVSMWIESFDRETGEVLWSHALDDHIALSNEEGGPALPLGPGSTVVLGIDGERVLLDLETGEMSELEHERFWCVGSEAEFTYKESFSIDGRPHRGRYGGSPVDVCDADGERLEVGDDLPALPNGVGRHVDGARLIRTSDGLIAIDEAGVG